MGKHAYLIMAHADWLLLSKLLMTLDDKRNDIYVHIDKKAKFNPSEVYNPINSQCTFIKRMNVSWGGDSQIKCELELLKTASVNKYDYYHLLSGADLPIKSQDEIHSFFERNIGCNYIKIDRKALESGYPITRIKEYHFFQNLIGRKKNCFAGLLYRLDSFYLSLQKKLKVNRLRNCPKQIYKGTNWLSITDEMVKTVLEEESFIKKYCYLSLCADEIFLQTIAINSELKSTVVDNDLRCIDWERGNPYTWHSEDYKQIIESNDLFARKFCYNTDSVIIEKIVEFVSDKANRQ